MDHLVFFSLSHLHLYTWKLCIDKHRYYISAGRLQHLGARSTIATAVHSKLAETMNSKHLAENKISVIFCQKLRCNEFGHGWQDCYCCGVTDQCYETIEKCRHRCNRCNTKCSPSESRDQELKDWPMQKEESLSCHQYYRAKIIYRCIWYVTNELKDIRCWNSIITRVPILISVLFMHVLISWRSLFVRVFSSVLFDFLWPFQIFYWDESSNQ